MASPSSWVPAIGWLISEEEAAGSSSRAWMPSLITVHAPTGSSSTAGPAGSWGPPADTKNAGTHSTMWRTTSRATQPSHGAGFSHAPSGTSRARSVKRPDTRR
jgi:hypothetical protein